MLGDNTVGKTTIAQAFRWVLYGAVLTELRKQQEDYQLLNNDILAMMDANSKADVRWNWLLLMMKKIPDQA